jgi:hypothetical protein
MVNPLLCEVNREFGLSNIACVMVPAVMNGVRSWGIRVVPWLVTVWLANGIVGGTGDPGPTAGPGVMLTEGMLGAPVKVVEVPWATIVVP